MKQVIEMLKIYRRRSKNNEKMVLKKSVVFPWKPGTTLTFSLHGNEEIFKVIREQEESFYIPMLRFSCWKELANPKAPAVEGHTATGTT